MSVVIIVGSGGHNAITRLVVLYPHMTSQQQADSVNAIQSLIDFANVMENEVNGHGPPTPLPR
jgi:hypothetical protein